jgi:hypothetical protein
MLRSFVSSRAAAALLFCLASASAALAAPLDCSNFQSNNTIYQAAVGSYDIICQVDYAGGDLLAQGGLATFEDCIELCDDTPGCIDISYAPGGGNCWMKSMLTTALWNGNIWTARSRVIKAGGGVTCVNNRDNGTIYDAVNGGSYQVFCGVDYAGGDMGASSESSFTKCLDKCDSTPGCLDVAYVAPSCYMKNVLTTPVIRGGVWTGMKVKKTVSSSSSSTVSSATSGSLSASGSSTRSITTSTIASSGSSSNAVSSTESANGSSSTSSVSPVNSSSSSTISSSFIGTSSSISTSSSTGTSSATSTSSSSTPSSTAPSCVNDQSDNKNFTTSAGSTYEIHCSREHYGGDLFAVGAATFETCINTCDSTPECIDVSYVGNACYMKKTLNALVPMGGVWSATKVQNSTVQVKVPLSCRDASTNGTTFKTDQGKFYKIYCGYDFPGGDFSAVTADTFEDCLKACDQRFPCVDVAYVAPSCYMKNSLTQMVPNQAVWAAKAVPDPGCAAMDASLYPVGNTDVDKSSLANLAPSHSATLNYAEKYPGKKAVSLFLTMLYPQITLENSALVSVSCSDKSLVVDAKNAATLQYIMNNWPVSGLVIFTNSVGCNNETSRGIYLTSGAYATQGSNTVTFAVNPENFTSIASEVAIKYGTVNYDSNQGPSATQYTSTCSGTGAASTASPTATPSANATSPLDPGALALYNALKAAIQYDADGNIIGHPANTKDVIVPVSPFDPTNTTAQAALEDQLRRMGLDPPASLADEGLRGARGVCYAPTKTTSSAANAGTSSPAKRSTKARRRSSQGYSLGSVLSLTRNLLAKRFGWSDFTDIACDDMVGDLIGAFSGGAGDGVQAACAANDLYQNRDAIKCLFSNCYTTTTIITYYTPPPATKYTFDYSWKVNFPPIQQAVSSQGPNKVLSCVNCGFSISNIQFSGQIVINMTAGVIKEAQITAGISGAASMIAGLQSDGPWNGNWSYVYSTTNLGAITLDNAFNIV